LDNADRETDPASAVGKDKEMLKAIEIENFKAFGERTRIELAPITLIFGENSGGKSSILQVLSLLKQTRQSREHGAVLLPRVSGGIVDLGSCRDMLFDHDLNRKLSIRLDMDAHEDSVRYPNLFLGQDGVAKSVGLEMAFTRQASADALDLHELSVFLNDRKAVVFEPTKAEAEGTACSKAANAATPDTETSSRRQAAQCKSIGEDVRAWERKAAERLARWLSTYLHNRNLATCFVESLFERIREDSSLVEAEVKAICVLHRELLPHIGAVPGLTPVPMDLETQLSFYESAEGSGYLLAELFQSHFSIELDGFCPVPYEEVDWEDEWSWPGPERIELNHALLLHVGSGDKLHETLARIESNAWLAEAITKRGSENPLPEDLQAALEQLECKNWLPEAIAKLRSELLPTEEMPNRTFRWIQLAIASLAIQTGRLLNTALNSLYPMGPYRLPPERWYIFAGTSPRDVGHRGQYLPDLLLRHPDLVQQTNDWLDRLGIGYHVEPRQLGTDSQNLFELRLLDNRRVPPVAVSLSDVGFGISQLLPFVVQCLASQGQIISIEQPEVHVHPRLQADIGDLLIDSIQEPRRHQFIVETHSEHLILRLQRRIRERVISPDDVAVIFVKRGPNGAEAMRLRLDVDGDFVDEWPGGFFPERLNELR